MFGVCVRVCVDAVAFLPIQNKSYFILEIIGTKQKN